MRYVNGILVVVNLGMGLINLALGNFGVSILSFTAALFLLIALVVFNESA